MKSDLVDIEGCIHHKTERAILFSGDGDPKNAVWLPLSMVEIDSCCGSRNDGSLRVITMSERLAIDKGLV